MSNFFWQSKIPFGDVKLLPVISNYFLLHSVRLEQRDSRSVFQQSVDCGVFSVSAESPAETLTHTQCFSRASTLESNHFFSSQLFHASTKTRYVANIFIVLQIPKSTPESEIGHLVEKLWASKIIFIKKIPTFILYLKGRSSFLNHIKFVPSFLSRSSW